MRALPASPSLLDRRRRIRRRVYIDQTYWSRPVPGFGDPRARVLLLGLAPGVHGANRTGRPFTGDGSGDFMVPVLHELGFANQPTATGRDDGLELRNAWNPVYLFVGLRPMLPPRTRSPLLARDPGETPILGEPRRMHCCSDWGTIWTIRG